MVGLLFHMAAALATLGPPVKLSVVLATSGFELLCSTGDEMPKSSHLLFYLGNWSSYLVNLLRLRPTILKQ